MIDRREVVDFSERLGLEARIVEKDFVLGWMLAGVRAHAALNDNWIFKGGTCLKKCFFETYRFSEDLDFTLRDPAHIEMNFLNRVFGEVAVWVTDNSGIEVQSFAQSFFVSSKS